MGVTLPHPVLPSGKAGLSMRQMLTPGEAENLDGDVKRPT